MPECNIPKSLQKDLEDHLCGAGDNLIFNIFPDDAFGFAINERFAQHFHNIFLTAGGTINEKIYFQDESMTTQFLNKIVMTAACLFDAAGQHHMKPLHYFLAINSNVHIRDAALDCKPDIVLLRLVDGNYTRADHINWKDVQALIEHTTSKELPKLMALSITNKNYLMFCAQPERNFILNLCITHLSIYVAISDHAGQIDTDLVSFDQPSIVLLFLQMVMGFTFLPDKWLGLDHTIIRRVHDQKLSEATFKSLYPILECVQKPKFNVNPFPSIGDGKTARNHNRRDSIRRMHRV